MPPPPEATQQPTPTRMTIVPWKWKWIGFEVLLLTNLFVKLESTTYDVETGSPSMTREGGGMTGVTASAGLHLGISPETQTPQPSDSTWSQTAPPYTSAPYGSAGNRQRWQQAALATANTCRGGLPIMKISPLYLRLMVPCLEWGLR